MKRIVAIICCGLLACGVSRAAERTDSVKVMLEVLDSSTDMPLRSARVSVADTTGRVVCDSMAVERHDASYRQAYDKYYYTCKLAPTTEYRLIISAEGYEPTERSVTTRKYPMLYLEETYLHRERRLSEVTVTATRVKMVMKGDTLEYDATAFQLPEGSMLDALIEALPGAQLSREGQITVNGEFVSELLVNGRSFFKGNPQVALQNLPSYTVRNVQVYRREPEQYRGLNISRDRTKDPLVMDVNLKREFMNNRIANVEAGGGSSLGRDADARWMGRLFAMRYSKISYLAFHASANNLNDAQRVGSGGRWAKAEPSAGDITTKRAGVEYNLSWADQQATGVNTQLDVIRQNSRKSTTSFSEQYLPGGNTVSRGLSTAATDSWAADWSGEISRAFSGNRVWFHTNVGYDSEAETESDDSEQEGLYKRRLTSDATQREFKTDFTLYTSWKMPWESRASLNARGKYVYTRRNTNGADFIDYLTDAESTDDISLLRRDRRPTRRWDYYVNPKWSRSDIELGKTKLSLSAEYKFIMDFNSGRRTLEEAPTPSATAAWALNEANSYSTTRRGQSHKFEVGARMSIGDVSLSLSGDATRSLRSLSDFRMNVPRELHRADWSHGASVSFDCGNYWTNSFGARFDLRQTLPEMMSLLDVADTSDPLNIRIGNPLLRKSTEYSAEAEYQKTFSQREASVRVSGSYTHINDAPSEARTFDRATGVSRREPRNVQGNRRAEISLSFGCYLDRRSCLRLDNDLTPRWIRSADYSSAGELPERMVADNRTVSDNLTLSYKVGETTVRGKAELAWTHAVSRSGAFAPFSYCDVNYGVSLTSPLPWNLVIETDVMAYCRRGYDFAGMNTTNWVWNLQLSKTFGPKKRWTVKLIGFDLLRQLPTVQRTFNAQGRTELRYSSQPSHALLTLSYRLP